ncbi:MAG: hypothetical protein N2C14_16695 [Planctomycetales bacterium]
MSTQLRIGVLYDASWLMDSSKQDWDEIPFSRLRGKPIETKRFLAKEVAEEISKHFDSGDAARAETARLRYAELLKHGATETSVRDFEPAPADEHLGSDTPLERRLLGCAEAMADRDEYLAVVIFTRDGGVYLDAVKLRQRSSANVFCVYDLQSAQDVQAEIYRLAESHKDLLTGMGDWLGA